MLPILHSHAAIFGMFYHVNGCLYLAEGKFLKAFACALVTAYCVWEVWRENRRPPDDDDPGHGPQGGGASPAAAL